MAKPLVPSFICINSLSLRNRASYRKTHTQTDRQTKHTNQTNPRGCVPESRWVGWHHELEDDTNFSHTEDIGTSCKCSREEEEVDAISFLDESEDLEWGTQVHGDLLRLYGSSWMNTSTDPCWEGVNHYRLLQTKCGCSKAWGWCSWTTEEWRVRVKKPTLVLKRPNPEAAAGCYQTANMPLGNKEAKISPEDILLLIERLLGSASHSISIERHKLVWAKMNPKLRSLGSEEYRERDTDLFGPGLRRIEVEKPLLTVTKSFPQPTKKVRYENDKSDLRSFLAKGTSVQYGNMKNCLSQLYIQNRFSRGRRYQTQNILSRKGEQISKTNPLTRELPGSACYSMDLNLWCNHHNYPTAGQPQILSWKLKADNLGHLGLACGVGLLLGADCSPMTGQPTQANKIERGAEQAHIREGPQTGVEGSSHGSEPLAGPVYQSHLPGPKKDTDLWSTWKHWIFSWQSLSWRWRKSWYPWRKSWYPLSWLLPFGVTNSGITKWYATATTRPSMHVSDHVQAGTKGWCIYCGA